MKRLISIISSLSFAVLAVLTSCVQETPQTTVPVRGIFLMPKSVELVEGGSKVLTATVSPANATDKSVSFRSNEPSVATVDQDGIVKAISPGEAIVTVTTNDGNYKDHCNVTVLKDVIHVDSVMLNESSLTLKEGESYTLTATVTPDNATDKSVVWLSDDESVATVSQDGKVKALKAGMSTTVTAISNDSGKSASCTVTVSATIGAVTGGSSNISCRNAVLSGKFNLSGDIPSDLKYGVMYSTSPDVPEESAVTLKGTSYDVQDRSYSITTEVLEPETTYYYCAYVTCAGSTKYGNVKVFSTSPVQTMLKTFNAAVTGQNNVTLKAKLDLTNCEYTSLEYGFEYGKAGSTPTTVKSTEIVDNGFSAEVSSLVYKVNYQFTAFVVLDGRKYIGGEHPFNTSWNDLGLSVYWATCNLGAESQEDYGGYYQWAGTQDVTSNDIYLDFINCPYHTGSGASTGWSKYIPLDESSYWSGDGSPDNKTVLDPEDDAAHVILGGNWRMPTESEWNELRNTNNCSWKWTTVNGVNGYKVTSNKPDYTDCYIFLPAAGMRFFNFRRYAGSDGCYWSSSLKTDYPRNAHYLIFGSDFVDGRDDCRYEGFSVRPVLDVEK